VAIKNKDEKLRFGIVGFLNTAIDFGILLTLRWFGVPAEIANYPSSTAAVIVSFFANKNYTFQSKGANLRREITLFLAFTLFCAWVLQPVTIIIVESILTPFALPALVATTIAKIIATVVTLIWNYTTYSRFVFKKESHGQN
jgi:putative flippase GtrA